MNEKTLDRVLATVIQREAEAYDFYMGLRQKITDAQA